MKKNIFTLVLSLQLPFMAAGLGVPAIQHAHAADDVREKMPATSDDPLETQFSSGIHACSDAEKWTFSQAIPQDMRGKFREFVAKTVLPVYGFADAVALATDAKTDEAKLFGKYWQYRALHAEQLVRTARDGFDFIVSQPVNRNVMGIQTAALECLTRIHAKYPSLQFSSGVVAAIPALYREYQIQMWDRDNMTTLHDAALLVLRSQISNGAPEADVKKTMAVFDKAGPYQNFAKGLWDLKRKDFAAASAELEAYFKEENLPPGLKRFQDEARLEYARALYLDGKFEPAIEQLKKTNKESNYTVRILTELAWNHLMKNEYPKAIGVAVNLQKGIFNKTFSPESLVVMAMAFNEICQYPSSFRSIRYFYRNYRSSHEWLSDWYSRKQKKQTAPDELYRAVLDFIERGKSPVPMQVVTEWARSPVLVADQELINLMLDEHKHFAAFKKQQDAEMKSLYKQTKEQTQEVSGRIKDAKKAGQVGKKTPEELRADIARVKRAREYYTSFIRAVKTYRAVMERAEAGSEARRAALVAEIDRDLQMRNIRMLQRLRELIETAYLIQVEIYNGASEDIVWRNAHPDYKDFTDKLKKEAEAKSNTSSYNWGPVKEVSNGMGEVWEDEMDSLVATLNDSCSNKDKYMNIMLSKPKSQGGEGEEPADAPGPGEAPSGAVPAGN